MNIKFYNEYKARWISSGEQLYNIGYLAFSLHIVLCTSKYVYDFFSYFIFISNTKNILYWGIAN